MCFHPSKLVSFSQRFAFTPLLDDGSDADDEEESEKLVPDISDTMKFRNTRNSTSSPRESRSVVSYQIKNVFLNWLSRKGETQYSVYFRLCS